MDNDRSFLILDKIAGDKMADNKSFESSLHDVVYSIDTGTGLKIIRVALYFLVLMVVVMIYTATQFRGFTNEESMDFAQLGRNFSFKQGMITKFVRPLSMEKVSKYNGGDPKIFEHPDLFHPPAYPALLATGFKICDLAGLKQYAMDGSARAEGLPAEKWIILPINHIFSIVTGFMIYLMGKRLFSNQIGLLGMTIYYLSDLVWMDSISGLNISMAICFMVASFYTMIVAMLNKRDSKGIKKWLIPFLLSILFAAIAFLTRYIAVVVVPGVCLFAWLMAGGFRGGTRYVFIFVLLYALLISPWLIRNYKACGNPIGMVAQTALYDTKEFPENSLARDLQPKISFSKGMEMAKEKWNLTYSGKHGAAIPAIGGGLLTALFLTTFFYHFVRPQVNYLRWGLGISMLLMAIIAGFFTDSSLAMLHAFWPFIILYGLSFFYILVDRLDLGVRLYNQMLKVLIVVLAMVPMIIRVLPPSATRPWPPYSPMYINSVAESIKPNEVVCTDMPWATAWYGDRISLLLPKSFEQYDTIYLMKKSVYTPVMALQLSGITLQKSFMNLRKQETSWIPFLFKSPPSGFNWEPYDLGDSGLLYLEPTRKLHISDKMKK